MLRDRNVFIFGMHLKSDCSDKINRFLIYFKLVQYYILNVN